MARVHYFTLSAIALTLALSGCSGGSNPLPPTVDMTGHWQLYLTPTGGVEAGPSGIFMAQSGAAIDGPSMAGSVSANNVSIISDVGFFVMRFNGSANATQATGSLTITGIINATGTFRMERFTPTGTMTMNGSIQGENINIAAVTTAMGSRDYLDQGLTQLDEIEFLYADQTLHMEVAIEAAGMTTGVVNIPGDVDATVIYREDTTTVEELVSSGSFTVTTYDGTRFAGTFTFNLTGGNTLTGSFDVLWDMDAYDP